MASVFIYEGMEIPVSGPELGDTTAFRSKRNMHRTMGGTIRSTSHDAPETLMLSMTFHSLSPEQFASLEIFFGELAGEQFRYQGLGADYIVRQLSPMLHSADVNRCKKELTIDFIGSRAGGYILFEDELGYLLKEDGNRLLLEKA